MSQFKKFNFCKITKLITLNWIKNNYKGKAIYPLTLKYLSATYIKVIVEQWQASPNCIVVSKSLTVTQTSKLLWGSIINGLMEVSTDGLGYHRWHLKINKIHREMLIGLDAISKKNKYRFLMYQDQYAIPSDLIGFHILWNERCYDPGLLYTRIIKDDKIVIALINTSLKISIIRNGACIKKSKRQITSGVYQLGVTLFDPGDSITISNMNSTYDLSYRDADL